MQLCDSKFDSTYIYYLEQTHTYDIYICIQIASIWWSIIKGTTDKTLTLYFVLVRLYTLNLHHTWLFNSCPDFQNSCTSLFCNYCTSFVIPKFKIHDNSLLKCKFYTSFILMIEFYISFILISFARLLNVDWQALVLE